MLLKIYNLTLFFSYPVIILFKLISYFKIIRFGIITPTRVGHLVGELALWHLENLNTNKKILNIWYVPNKTCNNFFIKKMSKKINITKNFFFKFLFDIFKKFEEKKFLITGPSHGERDIDSLISKNPNIIEFSEEEIELGNYNLAKMGINKNDEFVCITIRDNFYFKNFLKDKYSYKSFEFKNSDIENYNKAVKLLNKKNIKVIRMGIGSEKKWSLSDNKLNIDYSRSEFRSGFMDFFLVNKAKFIITNGTGFYWIPYILKKPLVMADFIPIANLCSYVPNSIHIFKHLYSKRKNRHLFLEELLSEEFNSIYREKDFSLKGLDYIDNNSDEILDCVQEMNDLIDRNIKNNNKNILNNSMQSQFWNLMPKKTIKHSQIIDSHKIINAKIGSNFLKKQFEANSSSQHT